MPEIKIHRTKSKARKVLRHAIPGLRKTGTTIITRNGKRVGLLEFQTRLTHIQAKLKRQGRKTINLGQFPITPQRSIAAHRVAAAMAVRAAKKEGLRHIARER